MRERGLVVAGALGECVHVAGVLRFLRLAERAGWRTIFLGPAVPPERLVATAREEGAKLVGVSYRLTPETGESLLRLFVSEARDLRQSGVRFAFGGTPPVAARARALGGFFEVAFDGSEHPDEVLAYLRGARLPSTAEDFPQTVTERIRWKEPYPLLRHHFGLPTVAATAEGIARIAEARVLDVVSLGTDQDAQENFYHPERQDARRAGAGGVAVRSEDDFRRLYEASRRGNYPLMRTYTGTDDLERLAEMYLDTINNAWGAVPLFWFNAMDGRGPHDLEQSVAEHRRLIAWYGRRNLPVELNEAHHWALREASDVTFVVASYLSAYNARALGVGDYIAPLMFNSPPGVSDAMDLAKMLASLEAIAPLEGPGFRVWRQTRVGLLSHPLDPDAARGHLGAATYLQMALMPHIIHVVGHTEADHAATADEVVAACRVVRRAVDNALQGAPSMLSDTRVQERKAELLGEAAVMLAAIRELGEPAAGDPLLDASTLARAVRAGVLDAPHLQGNAFARGETRTAIDDRGACVSISPETGEPISEEQRLTPLLARARMHMLAAAR